MNLIYSCKEVPPKEVRRPYFYLDPIVDDNGKLYTVFLLKRYVPSYGFAVYYPCIAFSSNTITDNNFFWKDIGFVTSTFNGRQILYRGNTTSVISDETGTINKTYGEFREFNTEKQIGFYTINGFDTFSLYNPPDKVGYIYSLNAKVIDYDAPDFWEKLEKIPKPKYAFEVDTSTEGGADGDYDDDQSDTIGLPILDFLNSNSISNTKFFSCYKMTPGQLSVFSEKLWTGWNDILQSLQNSVLKPLDFIVSLNMLPVNVESTTKKIKLGWFTIDNLVQGGLINQQYVRVDCGSIQVKKKWGGAIDYQTDVSLFLPFIGEVSLNTNEVMGATLSIIYTVDIMSGNCIASVQVVNDGLNAILYQYNGNVASNYAITSVDYSNVMAGALQLAQGIGSIATGNMLGGISSMVSATSNMLSGGDIKRAGNLSATSGFMGIKKPYLILSRPIQSLPSEYNTFRGYVSNITLALSECSGFTKVSEIHLENIPATSAELDELDGLLKAGVIF